MLTPDSDLTPNSIQPDLSAEDDQDVSKSSNSPSKTYSDVYKFIQKHPNKNGWQCLRCLAKNKEQFWNTRNTFNFRVHLIRNHSDVYATEIPSQSKIKHHFPK